eukprot:gene11422-12453_t
MISRIPDDLLFLFYEFLSAKDSRNFLAASKAFSKLKKIAFIYELNQAYSHQYCINEEFRKFIHSKIENPMIQIRLQLHGNYFSRIPQSPNSVFQFADEDNEEDTPASMKSIEDKVKGKIQLFLTSSSPDISSNALDTRIFNDLTVNYLELTDFPSNINKFPYILHLKLVNSNNNNLKRLKNIKSLQTIQLYSLNNFKDCSNFTHLSEVKISHCPQLINTSGLENIPYLHLEFCSRLADISKLGNHEELILRSCSQVFDLRSLAKVRQRLELKSLPSITSIVGLEKIPTLEIWDCKQLRIPPQHMINSIFQHRSLKLVYCYPDLLLSMPKVSPPLHSLLQSVLIVDSSITSVECFRGVKSVSLERCWNIVNVTPLSSCQKVSLINCINVKDISSLLYVSNLLIK